MPYFTLAPKPATIQPLYSPATTMHLVASQTLRAHRIPLWPISLSFSFKVTSPTCCLSFSGRSVVLARIVLLPHEIDRVVVNSNRAMRIMVRTLRGDRVALDVDAATTTVAQVKGMVMARERVPVAMQRLFFAGCHLDDDGRPLAHYGVQHDSVLFLGLHLRADTAPYEQEMHNLQVPSGSMAVKQQELHHQQQQQMRVQEDANNGGEELEKVKSRKPLSRRALRKILSRLHVDAWTRQHDAKFLDLLLRHTAGGARRNVGDLSGEDWSAIRTELNAATGSGFPVEELQRRLGEFRREFEAVGRIKSHPGFGYDPRRRVVVADEAEWKRYTLENPEAAAYEGRRPHLCRLRAIFSGDGGLDARGGKSRESWPKRCLSKLLRSFGLRCKL